MTDNAPFWENIFRKKNTEDQLLSTLKKLPLFSGLSSRKIRAISAFIADSVYAPDRLYPGEIIFEQGQEGAGMYVLLLGKINIYLDYHIDQTNLVAEIEPGDFFGEINLLDELPRTATAVAIEPSEVLFFHGREFRESLKANPDVGYEIMKALAEVLGKRLRVTDDLLLKKDKQLKDLQAKLKEDL